MKQSQITFTLSLVLVALLLVAFEIRNETKPAAETVMQKDSLLRHVVLFKFKPETSKEDIKKVEDAFTALPSKIPQIVGYEWGLNNSPEGLNDGFTHCFFLTFNSEEDRATYLPHPDHKAFADALGPYLDGVLVVDYWTK
ncbi:Dabb family protein [Zobellia russellii]|uniref:Dabb family protein n=1 Tax=Zobellia russellii TaxID=248907 RepID=UPI001BFF4035|nr:Dabb family protein [Zobellia russellii]MBT9190026.1 Dabb family protein [Zobellia russellii]